MRRNSSLPGVGETFDEYFENGIEPVREGSHADIEYRIYTRQKRDRRGRLIDTHYTAYIRLPESICEEEAERRVPHPPGHHGVNFGPTEDNWIGFGTLDDRDYNYDERMQPLDGDRRMEPERFFDDEEPSHFTPSILEDAIVEWIEQVVTYLDERQCRTCGA